MSIHDQAQQKQGTMCGELDMFSKILTHRGRMIQFFSYVCSLKLLRRLEILRALIVCLFICPFFFHLPVLQKSMYPYNHEGVFLVFSFGENGQESTWNTPTRAAVMLRGEPKVSWKKKHTRTHGQTSRITKWFKTEPAMVADKNAPSCTNTPRM